MSISIIAHPSPAAMSVRCKPASPVFSLLSPGAMDQSDPTLVQQELPANPQPQQVLPAGQQDVGMGQAQL
eukprot:4611950-Lingulodinium_polyedra.AAC.1